MKVLILSVIILALSALFYIEGEHGWKIKIQIPKEKELIAEHMFEHNKFIEFHPLCTSNKLIKDEGKEKEFEIVEEPNILGLINLKLTSRVNYKKLEVGRYSYNVPLTIMGIFKVNFHTEFSIKSTDDSNNLTIEESVKIAGPFLSCFIIGKVAYPEHVIMLDRIKQKLQ